MTGNDVFNRVLNLLGYLNSYTTKTDNQNLLKRAPDIINQVCLDLKIPNITRLSDEIEASDKALDALCYGAAMIMALVDGDGVKNKMFSDIYNAKRAAALSSKDVIVDKLPNAYYGS